MKGIITAAGKGSRLEPISISCNKQLLPIYDKPMIYYPLTTLIEGGIQDILIVMAPQDSEPFERLLKDGSQWGISISYAVQSVPRGIAEVLMIAKNFLNDDSLCLILGDNIFYSESLQQVIQVAKELHGGARIFGCLVNDPRRFGVVEFDTAGRVLGIEEKPDCPKSDYAVPGLYFYDKQAVTFAEQLQPSDRGELEITDVNRMYLSCGQLQVEILGADTVWMDTGSSEALLEAAIFVQQVQERQQTLFGSPETAAYLQGFITYEQLQCLGKQMEKTAYGQVLLAMAK